MRPPVVAPTHPNPSAADAANRKEESLRELRGSLMVVASLMATATYQAAVAPPQGLEQADKYRFNAFRIVNTFSFVNSVGIMMQLVMEAVVTGKVLSMATMKVLMVISLLCFSGAFSLVISRNWRSTSYAMASPIYYFVMCLVIEYLFKRKQRRRDERANAGPSAASHGEVPHHPLRV